MITPTTSRILVLGASGLIGRFVTDDLRRRGFAAIGVARAFSASQLISPVDIELPIMALDATGLAGLMRVHEIDVVVNCLGVLQDGPGSNTDAVHREFVARLLAAIAACGRSVRFIHISIPGTADEDHTAFATTKREAERLIASSGIPHAILRPGFVIAPSAYGGSAMMRALAAFPIDLPAKDAATPFQPVAVADIAATIAWLAARPIDDEATRAVSWDLMQSEALTLGDVIGAFRRSFGTTDWPRLPISALLVDLGALAGDLSSRLGWMPPMRSTAIAELRRGVRGDPAPWIAATGITPTTLDEAVGLHGASIQDKWFARLFLIKALMIASLVLFWVASGSIALFISFPATTAILTTRGWPEGFAVPFAAITSMMDISVGMLIAFRKTAAFGLAAGIFVSLGYMLGCAVLSPDLWLEPLGALVKTGPAIVLMLVALLMMDNR
ncbi:nucleoside-diphosphate sugar epimerase [Bradyrhizobium sp. SSBR45G]|uniref:SDR family oxidoreductase n=1 Tax=unclassified Bradyrhizobium TaxID=2631580 RepID=UPI002342AB85|nr:MULTISPECIES: SDR family oxidoreductase [unclassified Bradyrhizobium]GLH76978.1 nucleoside-diphosphate sugar epimerase [Bradyrhizobium sp. SSBR45G]GLH83736.1 nucleoside-diphosphate sugar epimerase [Bradyrhizobium sp. SSBR45R]